MIINSLYIIAGIIGFIITIILLFNKKSNPIMSIYMVLLIFIISCRFYIYGIVTLISDNAILGFYLKYSNISSIVIPLCYLYFKNINNQKQFLQNEILHFIFPVCYFFTTILIHNYIAPELSVKLLMFSFFLAFLILYIYLSYQVLSNTVWNKKGENKTIKKQNKKIYNWTLFLFSALILTSIRLSVSLFIEIYQNKPTTGLNFQWISAIIWIAILIKILVTPEILYGYKILNNKLKEDKNSNLVFNQIWKIQPIIAINNSQHLILKEKIDNNLQNYFEEIEKISLQHGFFRDPNLTLTDLATKLSIPKSHLSYLYKYHATISFSDYRKRIRIQDAINLIEDGYLKNNTLDSLSKKIGFTSYNPFFTSFKGIIGIAPVEYINNIHGVA